MMHMKMSEQCQGGMRKILQSCQCHSHRLATAGTKGGLDRNSNDENMSSDNPYLETDSSFVASTRTR